VKTKIVIKCDISINMGDVGGYHSKDNLEQIKDAFIRKGTQKLMEALKDVKDISMANPKFTITMSEE